MSRDYKSHKPSTAIKSKGSLILGLFIGYALGLISAIGVWMYLSQAPSPFLSNEKSIVGSQTKHGTGKTPIKPPALTPSEEELAKAGEKPQFDFYKILPGIEEPVTEQEFKQAVQQPSPPKSNNESKNSSEPNNNNRSTENYFLQAGSFRETDEAENLKARLALLGVVASVQTAELPEKGTWHRVRIGPFKKIDDVDLVRASLQQNDIETSFIKVKNAQ